jgi:hypothetical protein
MAIYLKLLFGINGNLFEIAFWNKWQFFEIAFLEFLFPNFSFNHTFFLMRTKEMANFAPTEGHSAKRHNERIEMANCSNQ